MRVIDVVAVAVTSLALLVPHQSNAATLPRAADRAAVKAATAPAPAAEAPASQVGPAATAEATPPSTTPTTLAATPTAPPKPAAPTLIARVNLTKQTMIVLVDGKQTYSWKVSSGAEGHSTPVGTFKPDWMAKMWHSKQYDDAPMPHSVFFKDGAAIHATTSLGRLGTAASHGCVRLSPANAETFYKLVAKHGMAMTRIAVSGHAPATQRSREDRIASDYGRLHANSRNDLTYRSPTWPAPFPGTYYSGEARARSSAYYPAGSTTLSNQRPYWVR